MLGTSFFIHLAALVFCCLGAFEVIQLRKQKKFLLSLLKNNPREKFLFLSPLDYTAFLAKTFRLEFSGKPMLKWLAPRRINGETLLTLLSSQKIHSLAYEPGAGEGALILVFHGKDHPSDSLLETLTRELDFKVKGYCSDSLIH